MSCACTRVRSVYILMFAYARVLTHSDVPGYSPDEYHWGVNWVVLVAAADELAAPFKRWLTNA